jgi:predicted amidohydrolase
MRVAAVQMSSTAEKAQNLESAEKLVRAAAAEGARLVVLPETFNVLGHAETRRQGAEPLEA